MSNLAINRTIASCYDHGTTNIPLPKSVNRSTSLPDKWKAKYEESERQRKSLLTQNERTSRNFSDLERKYLHLKLQNTVTQNELSEKSDQLKELRNVSQNLYKEYDTLKNQYELETTAMHKALSEAEQWWKQNRELKRLSTMVHGRIETIADVVDSGEDNEDLEGLRAAIKEMSANNAKLQTELNEAKLAEFEATEQVANLQQELEVLQRQCKQLTSEVEDIRNRNEQLIRVSKLMSNELAELKETEQKHRENAVNLRHEADDAKKERNVLAHQSTLLLQGISLDGDRIHLLQEIEQLKRSLEDTTNKYEREIAELQDKIEDRENNPVLEIAEERLKIAEDELKHALEKLENLEIQSNSVPTAPLAPPPPPPPPLPLSDTLMNKTEIPRKLVSLNDIKLTAVDNPGETEKKPSIQAPIEDIVNQIKGGQFTLRSTNKQNQRKQREEPKAVTEMLKILGTLRRCPNPRNSLNVNKTT